MLEVILLGLALGMDAFAISIGISAQRRTQVVGVSAISIAIYFGAFHALLPFAGFAIGASIFEWIEAVSTYVCFGILVLIGGKSILEYFSSNRDKESPSTINHAAILALTLAVSVDAFAAGFTLNLLSVKPISACLAIGAITFCLSMAGDYIGKHGAVFMKNKAELFGGIILIGIGVNILLK